MTKTCTKCKETKAIDKFYATKNYKWETDGHDYYCKSCRTGTALASQRGGVRKKKCAIDDCELLHYAKTYCRVHYTRLTRNGTTDLINDNSKRYGNEEYEYIREYHLNKKYKLTSAKYVEMAKDGCEICGKHALPYKKLHVDHDHKCCPVTYDEEGRSGWFKTCGLCVRGIVCDKCNQAIGRYERGIMRDDYPNKDKIILYVAKYDALISDRIDAYDKEQGDR